MYLSGRLPKDCLVSLALTMVVAANQLNSFQTNRDAIRSHLQDLHKQQECQSIMWIKWCFHAWMLRVTTRETSPSDATENASGQAVLPADS